MNHRQQHAIKLKQYSHLSFIESDKRISELEALISDKQEEFEPLINSITGINQQINLLTEKINNAPALLASGEIKTDAFLKWQSELTTLTNSL